MAQMIYDAQGSARAFRLGSYIYAPDGAPIGRVVGEKAYRFDGTYVGVIIKDMIVDRPDVSRRNLAPVQPPPGTKAVRMPSPRQLMVDTPPDLFDLLAEQPGSSHEER